MKRQLSHFETATTLLLNGRMLFKGKVEEQARIFSMSDSDDVTHAARNKVQKAAWEAKQPFKADEEAVENGSEYGKSS